MFTKISEAIEEIKNGKSIILVDDENEENSGVLLTLSDNINKENINFMTKHGSGIIYVALKEDRFEELNLPKLVDGSGIKSRDEYSISLDHESTSSGVSAEDKATTIKMLIKRGETRRNFRIPGSIFPRKAINGGVLKRADNLEAAVDIAILSGSYPSAVLTQILNEDGTLSNLNDIRELAEKYQLSIVSIEDLIAYRRERECYVTKEAEANLPTEYGDFRMVGFVNRLNGEHHVALVKGDINEEDKVLVRVHSECLTGDAFHSLKCDCGEQLAAALNTIEKEGKGVLLYLRQEGRGIGLINKIKAYKLQEEGLDTEEANIALGFPADMRDYGIGAQILSELKVKKIRLMTNNPKKLVGLKGHGIEVVERVPLIMDTNLHNARYFKTKKEKMGHLY
ncbi:GTP cyclohydrolase II [Clostridium fungisolvens]|uniref:GTP cyclohydrolase-2 n=1 Tax=Clostridium fungisolvens TaxID=1604897 RepID=A0A6V8SKW6_9CLOT|nr:GTP cyclohydrolase II [Clostridium fungisolvens]GFP77817.1 Riboflavin biosynthesis protein RibBA [Clostridium fungisolvens]